MEELEKIKNYLKNFIDKMLVSDIKELDKNNIAASYPYLALAFMGIDFLGLLNKGNHGKDVVGKRFRWFIVEWMGKVNDIYKNKNLAPLIYDCCRCGIFHNAVLKNSFNISSYFWPEDNHLHYVTNKKLIFLHSKKFAFDFIEAQDKFREDLQKKDIEYIKKVYNNLNDMVEGNKRSNKDNFDNFVKYLQKNDKVFYATTTTTTETTTVLLDKVTMTEPPLHWNCEKES